MYCHGEYPLVGCRPSPCGGWLECATVGGGEHMDDLIARLAGPPSPPEGTAKPSGSRQERRLPVEVTLGASKRSQSPVELPRAIEFIPYNAIYDPQADSFLAWMWRRMQEDDLVELYFPGQKETGFATFVRLFSGDAQVALIT